MQKVEIAPNITIHQGEALRILETLPDCSVDAVLTDPPYSSGGMTLNSKQQDPSKKYLSAKFKTYPPMLGDNKDQRSFTSWSILWLHECWRAAKNGAPLMLFTDWRQLPSLTDAMQGAGWLWLGIVPWDKPNSRPQLGKFKQQCEYVLFGSKGKFERAHNKCLPGLYRYSVNGASKVHTTSKPLELIIDLLEVTKSEALVLDPFIGGGTTPLACKQTGRGCIGIELSKEYYQIAIERIKAAA